MTTYTDDTYVSYVPDDLKAWLNEHSPRAPDWMHVYQRWVEFDKDVEATRDFFRKEYMMDTSMAYDSDHPNVMPGSSG